MELAAVNEDFTPTNLTEAQIVNGSYVTFTKDGAKTKFANVKEASKADAKDIIILSIFCSTSSSKWVKPGTLNKVGYDKAVALIDKYNLVNNKALITDAKQMTVAQVCLAWGDLYIGIINGNLNAFKNKMKGASIAGLPIAYHWSGAGSYIPRKDSDKIFYLYVIWALSFDYQITAEKEKKNWKMSERFPVVFKFCNMQYMDSTPTEVREKAYAASSASTGSAQPADVLKNIVGPTADLSSFLALYKLTLNDISKK